MDGNDSVRRGRSWPRVCSESPQDRLLVIYGASHAAILKDQVRSSPDLQLIEAAEFLRKR